MKTLIFDSSSIISLSLNNLLDVLRLLKKKFDGRFLITPEVKREVVDVPLRIRRFELEALMISKLIKDGVLGVAENPELKNETEKFYQNANSMYSAEGEKIKIVHYGEASCLALASLLKNDVAIAVDERTTRMLCEKPENLKALMESKLHTVVSMDESRSSLFTSFRIIRSSELAYVALKSKLLQLPASDEQTLDALLFALRFKGCAISREEIEEIKHM